MRLIYALLLTVVSEGLVMFAITRSQQWVFCNILCNLVTNPTLNILLSFIVYPAFGSLLAYRIGAIVGEILVFVGEAHLYRAMIGADRKKCYVRSVATNAVSLLLGLLVLK